MKTIFYITLFFLLASFLPEKTSKNECEVQITTNSTLYIKGTSNVNTFVCNYGIAALERKVNISYRKAGTVITFDNAVLKLKNSGFDCGGKMINKDFHELLKSDDHPYISLELQKFIKHDYGYTAYVIIEIAGKKNNYAIPVKQSASQGKYSGKMDVKITDFGLMPPKKMMGMIVVHESIEIHFDFDLLIETE